MIYCLLEHLGGSGGCAVYFGFFFFLTHIQIAFCESPFHLSAQPIPQSCQVHKLELYLHMIIAVVSVWLFDAA